MKWVGMCMALVFLIGCARLYHAQIGEIDNRAGFHKKKIEIMVSETGINVQEAGAIAKALAPKKARRQIQAVEDIIALFQMGPRTGNPVYNATYASELGEKVRAVCPSGNITGLMSIREARKYPVISGEIVKITGYCLTKG